MEKAYQGTIRLYMSGLSCKVLTDLTSGNIILKMINNLAFKAVNSGGLIVKEEDEY